MQNLNLTLALILEVVAFLSFAAVGFLLPVDTWLQIACVVFLFLLLILFWGRFMSPRAPKKVSLALYYLFKFVIFAIAAFALFYLFGQSESIVFFVASFLNDSLLFKYNKSRF